MPGIATSVAEVAHVSRHGFWLLLGCRGTVGSVRVLPVVQEGNDRTTVRRVVADAESPLLAATRC